MKKHILTVLGLTVLATQITSTTAFAQNTNVIPEGAVAQATDTQVPTDVEKVKATAANASVKLTWSAATDNVGVTGYKIYYGNTSVTAEGGTYTVGPVDAGNKTEYTINGLENGKPYYFVLTAYDKAGNESEFYSLEVTATPVAETKATSDIVAPKVVKATAVSKNLVKVEFSEGVLVPAVLPQSAFSIKNDSNGTALEVIKAEIDTTDTTQKTIILTTADQVKAVNYIITAGIQIKDLASNPIVSGTSDTAIFAGTDALPPVVTPVTDVKPAAEEKPVVAADSVGPAFVAVKTLTANTLEVEFSEAVVLKADPRASFIITDAKDNSSIFDISKVELAADGKKAVITTVELKNQDYNLLGVNIKDAAGNEMPIEKAATTFKGPETTVDKPVTPDNQKVTNAAENLVAKAVSQAVVRLSWTSKEENIKDITNFVVYMSTDKGVTYGEGKVVDLKTLKYDFSNLKDDMVYYFKLTSKNAAGVESEALFTSLTLPKTGPGLLLLLAGSAGAGALFTGKKKKK